MVHTTGALSRFLREGDSTSAQPRGHCNISKHESSCFTVYLFERLVPTLCPWKDMHSNRFQMFYDLKIRNLFNDNCITNWMKLRYIDGSACPVHVELLVRADMMQSSIPVN